MSQKSIATLKIINESTGEATPVNVRTCAEAVTCPDDTPLDQNLAALDAHAKNEGMHLTAEEKAGLETKEGAQAKAEAAQEAAYTAASLLVQAAKTDLSADASTKAEAARKAANKYTDELGVDLDHHANDNSNPHRVTAAQVGLGNVPNKSTNDLVPTYTESSTFEQLKSGERLAVAFGKLAKAINVLLGHISNKGNPHNVWHNQVGAAPKIHTHDAGDLNTGTLSPDRLPVIPMEVGVEYETTERFMGKTVYVKLVDFGKLPSNDTWEVEHGAVATQIIRACGQASNGMAFPVGTGGNGFYYIGLRVGLTNIEVYTDTDAYSGYTATVQIWYTKD